MKKINKVIFSLLLVATQLIYTSQYTDSHGIFRNSHSEPVLIRSFHNENLPLSYLVVTIVPHGYISHSFYRNGMNRATYTNNNGTMVTVPLALTNRVTSLDQYYLMEQQENNTHQDEYPMDIHSCSQLKRNRR